MGERGVGPGADAPVLGTPDAFPERTGRAGRTGRSVGLVIIAVVVALAMGGWGYVMMSAKGDPEVQNEVIAFEVQGPGAVTITFQAHKAADRAAVCRLRATDTDHAEVGARDVSLPAGQADVRLTERVVTSARATSGHVQYCYLVQ
ncbi:hypothetical protein Ssi03_40120 [Sphaerisporangium siamense]|uniref:DUF4307 domain-containing protein n=1 Tax=Sphaerisporangium siamense TaxID=795645 RepID=A0A7W7D5V5_9ACTN|nr:DUF4307 domain-containing protein [Sphaerisporangium siamense]MBB4700832.1 hypothetical protein [Sphaerisporangium siamense]GII86022.1 hypothetical protein Ssi03_40120 [Sphaerisporangium siamense]